MGRRLRVFVLMAWCGSGLIGCSQPKNRHYLGEAELQYYKDFSTSVDYPNVETMPNEAAQYSERPPTVRDPVDAKMDMWDLSLAEAIQMAIANNKVIRSRGAFKSPGNMLLANPDRVPTTYDPSIQETSTNFLQRGPEAALAAFDTQFKMNMDLAHSQMLQNNALLGGGIIGGNALQSDTASMQSSLSKTITTGGEIKVSNNWNYLGTNQPLQLFPSYYQTTARADFRQPLLAGSGVEYTRIAGPSSRAIPGILMVDQGVLIARINTDISIADFELNVINLIKDVEDQYWELYLAYRTYEAEKKAQTAMHNFWQTTKRRADAGALQGGAVDEGQARENYFNTRARVENAVTTMYTSEALLRRLLGLSVNDGRFIRPSDDPLAMEYKSDWIFSLTESLSRRVELRRQKWQVKSLELQLRAAESLVRPRLDFVGSYQLNGFGQHLFGENNYNGTRGQRFTGSYDTLAEGNQQAWDVGVEFSLPIGMRAALTLKNNLELKLTKSRAVLAAQELEVSHELGNSFALIDNWYTQAETNRDRHVAALKQLDAVERQYDAGRIQVDLLLRSQANAAAAETAYYTALTRYNQAILDYRMRKGSLLEDSNIHLAEAEWTQEARVEALRRAWARSFARPAEKLRDSTEPLVAPSPWSTGTLVPAGNYVPAMPENLGPTPDPIPFLPQPDPAAPESSRMSPAPGKVIPAADVR